MTIKLSDIRFMIEQEVRAAIDNQDMVNWANQVNSDVGPSINLPDTAQIVLNTTAVEYSEPANLKIINRMWLQSDKNNGSDKEFSWPYRRYNGKIILGKPFHQADTLNVDFYKHMTYFTAFTQPIDLADRYSPLYVSYGLMKYYKSPAVIERMGEQSARQESQLAAGMYASMKQQVVSLYSLTSDPIVISERW